MTILFTTVLYFFTKFIFSEWQMASMRRGFSVLNFVLKPQFHEFRPFSVNRKLEGLVLYPAQSQRPQVSIS